MIRGTDWCFGTFFMFPYIRNFIIRTDEQPSFFRGLGLNHQPGYPGIKLQPPLPREDHHSMGFLMVSALVNRVNLEKELGGPEIQ